MLTNTGNKRPIINHMFDNVAQYDEIEMHLAEGQTYTIATDAEGSAGFAQ